MEQDASAVPPSQPDVGACSPPRPTMGDVYTTFHRRNWIAFWLLGMINNFHYCLVLSAADEIATSFNLKSYVALVSWANVFFGIVVRLLNAFVYTNVPYNKRYLIAGSQTLLGIVLVSCAKYMGSSDWFRFVVALVGVVFCGNGSTYGESVSLGYMERYPSSTVGGWSSGTGMSGVLSSLIYMGLSAAGMSNAAIFLASSPLVLVYWYTYFFVLRVPHEGNNNNNNNGADDALSTFSSNWAASPWRTTSQPPWETRDVSTSAQSLQQTAEAEVVAINPHQSIERAHLLRTGEQAVTSDEEQHWCVVDIVYRISRSAGSRLLHWCRRNWATTRHIHRITFSNNINLLIVYVAEYAIQFMAPFSFPCEMVKHSSNFWISNSFVVTQFCYQVGVLISRSSLLCLRIRKVWILSVIQCVNAVFWFAQAKLLFVGDTEDENRERSLAFILFAYMVFVGLFGGASYVNVFYNILELDDTELSHADNNGHNGASATTTQERRQLSMNIGAVYAIAGISLGSFADLLFSNTVLTDTC